MQVNFIPKVWFDIKVTYKDKIEEERTGEAHSWVRNEWNFMASLMCFKRLYGTNFGSGYLTLKSITGALLSDKQALISGFDYDPGLSFERSLGYYAPSGDNSRGIVVGSSTASEDFDAHKLVSPIAHGTTSGQLKYYISRDPSASWDGILKQWLITWTRHFDNVSGGTVLVGEIGLIFYSRYLNAHKFLVDRSVFNPVIEIPNARLLTVSYKLYFQFPE